MTQLAFGDPRVDDALTEAIDFAAEAIDLLQANGIDAPDLV